MSHVRKTGRYNAAIALFNNGSPQSGQAGNLHLQVVHLESGYRLDTADGLFRASPVTPNISLAADAVNAHHYFVQLEVGTYPRGLYRAVIKHSDGREWTDDFNVGLNSKLSLGVAATYDGTTLNLTAWVEEDGLLATDFTSLGTAQILDSHGAESTTLTFTAGSSGYFYATKTISIAVASRYVLKVDALTPRPTGSDASFRLLAPIVRP